MKYLEYCETGEATPSKENQKKIANFNIKFQKNIDRLVKKIKGI